MQHKLEYAPSSDGEAKELIQINGMFYPGTGHLFDIDKWKKQRKFQEKAFPYVRQWGSCIDGGAFVGMWAKRYAEKFERVYAFEPLESNIRCLLMNAPDVTVIPSALVHRQTYAPISVKLGNFATVGKGGRAIFSTSIDSFDYDRLGLIKLDVEGCELKALQGAVRTLEKHRPVIVIEVKFEGDKIREWLSTYGYSRKEATELDEIWWAE